jgi:hypothetical protein
VKEERKRLFMIITLVKSNKSSPLLQQMLNSVALLAECTGRALYLLSGVSGRKLLKSKAMHSSHTKSQFFCHEEGVLE